MVHSRLNNDDCTFVFDLGVVVHIGVHTVVDKLGPEYIHVSAVIDLYHTRKHPQAHPPTPLPTIRTHLPQQGIIREVSGHQHPRQHIHHA